jgi:threonine dehydrogenase-like Zn-dependent dehydrogenase
MSKVLVLGCGPAGMLAAHAAKLCDQSVTIISEKQPSFIAGAQFLHTAIPGLTLNEPDGQVTFVHKGTKEQYAQKVYGDPEAPCSWDTYPDGAVDIWNLQRHYLYLWELYEHMVTDGNVFPAMIFNAAMEDFDVILSTIPLQVLFPDANYTSERVRIADEVVCSDQKIVYSGRGSDPWYRASNIFSNAFVEYPDGPAFPGARFVRKPLSNDVVNPHGRLHLLGRYGKWQKGVNVDDAFREALAIVEAL